ncbi:MAG TPA: hypothetical protein EYQ44_02060 [Porticoccaceae bacterium]|nr:hypothetical protein [Porticoccaceae bacterium]HIK79339.1 hypothetical protein [Porticoccaceae bacterium]
MVFDRQFEDAKTFLVDQSHQVTSGFSANELIRVKQRSEHYSYSALNRFLIYVLCGLITAIALLLIIVYSYW